MQIQELLSDYSMVYNKLYQRPPREIRYLGEGWVLVNGARMTASELEQLTLQLRKEFDKAQASKRTVVQKLLKWFSTPRAEA